jgi:hypothetical protein
MHLVEVKKRSTINDDYKLLYFITEKSEDIEIYSESYKIAHNDLSYHNFGYEITYNIIEDNDIFNLYLDKQIEQVQNEMKPLKETVSKLKKQKKILNNKNK